MKIHGKDVKKVKEHHANLLRKRDKLLEDGKTTEYQLLSNEISGFNTCRELIGI